MDTGAILLTIMEIVAVAILGVVLVWAVVRTRSRGRESSDDVTEQATRALYQDEDRTHHEGLDGRR